MKFKGLKSHDGDTPEADTLRSAISRLGSHLAVHTRSAFLHGGQQAPLLVCPFLVKYQTLCACVRACVCMCVGLCKLTNTYVDRTTILSLNRVFCFGICFILKICRILSAFSLCDFLSGTICSDLLCSA